MARGRPPANPGQGSPAAGPIQPNWVIRKLSSNWTVPKARGLAELLRPLPSGSYSESSPAPQGQEPGMCRTTSWSSAPSGGSQSMLLSSSGTTAGSAVVMGDVLLEPPGGRGEGWRLAPGSSPPGSWWSFPVGSSITATSLPMLDARAVCG